LLIVLQRQELRVVTLCQKHFHFCLSSASFGSIRY